eukprot:4956771-Ditylum_brightwellii.AAC.1
MASKGTSPPPMHKRGEVCRYLPWEGGWGNEKDVSLAIATTVVFIVFVKKGQSLLCVAGSILTQ